jgi:hypothetical protein
LMKNCLPKDVLAEESIGKVLTSISSRGEHAGKVLTSIKSNFDRKPTMFVKEQL